jgi:hypothetical protein
MTACARDAVIMGQSWIAKQRRPERNVVRTQINHPTMTFGGRSITGSREHVKVTGDLTIRGQTRARSRSMSRSPRDPGGHGLSDASRLHGSHRPGVASAHGTHHGWWCCRVRHHLRLDLVRLGSTARCTLSFMAARTVGRGTSSLCRCASSRCWLCSPPTRRTATARPLASVQRTPPFHDMALVHRSRPGPTDIARCDPQRTQEWQLKRTIVREHRRSAFRIADRGEILQKQSF